MPEEIVTISLPATEEPLVCNCEDALNITTTQLNAEEGIQECSVCLRFSKFPLVA